VIAIKSPTALIGTQKRRQLTAALAIGIGSLATASVQGETQSNMTEPQSTGGEGLLTYIHQEIEIKASPQRIYDALLDPKQFVAFTGIPAEISRDAGGCIFRVWGLDRRPKRGTGSPSNNNCARSYRALNRAPGDMPWQPRRKPLGEQTVSDPRFQCILTKDYIFPTTPMRRQEIKI
jgi:hypothetical protein